MKKSLITPRKKINFNVPTKMKGFLFILGLSIPLLSISQLKILGPPPSGSEVLHFSITGVTDNNYAWFTSSTGNAGSKIGLPANSDLFQLRQEANSHMDFYTNGLQRMRLNNNGWLGIGTTAPIGVATVWMSSPGTGVAPIGPWGWAASGTVVAPGLSVQADIETPGGVFAGQMYIISDERLKKEFKPLDDWRKILDIGTYSFKYNDLAIKMGVKQKNGLSYGFKAQEVYKSFPELTARCGDILTMDYVSFVPFLLEGLKTHEQQLNQIELSLANQPKVENEKIASLESENKLLKERLDILEAKLNAVSNSQGETIGKTKIQIGLLKDKPVLEQNEPNPFTEKTEIRYFLPDGVSNASIEVKNSEGKSVGNFLLNGSGLGSISINPGTLSAGTYYYSLIANKLIVDTKKMTLIK